MGWGGGGVGCGAGWVGEACAYLTDQQLKRVVFVILFLFCPEFRIIQEEIKDRNFPGMEYVVKFLAR